MVTCSGGFWGRIRMDCESVFDARPGVVCVCVCVVSVCV